MRAEPSRTDAARDGVASPGGSAARIERFAYVAWAVALATAAGGAFYRAGLAATGGDWPAPLDDVFIHFGFARSTALGHPFEWIPGNGYSSGDTSLLYPWILAPGWAIGFRGLRLGIFAALVACASIVAMALAVRRIVSPAPRWVAWLAAPMVVAIGQLDWSLYSGMEVAPFGAAAAWLVVAAIDASRADVATRARAQWRVGALGLAAVALRPEAVALVAPVAIAVAYAGCTTHPVRSLARAAGPAAALVVAAAIANRMLTGEWGAAGAVLKLWPYNPYMSGLAVAREVAISLVVLRVKAFGTSLSAFGVAGLALPALAAIGLFDRERRPVAAALVAAVVGWTLLVAFNANARFHDLRYVAPAIALLVFAAAVGMGTLARARRLAPLSGALAIVAVAAPLPRMRAQIEHFARASANVHDQQIEVARRLASMSPRPRRVLVGDAGAIPYVSGLDAIDGLGLGGFRGLPFARAAVHGVPAVVELLERLPEGDRPDVMALYPGWWKGLADRFGERIDAVRIDDNVICAADEKVVYRADWSALASPSEPRVGALDSIDVADLVDERAHAYELPKPEGGWVIGDVLPVRPGGARRFDAGRIVPDGATERFRVAGSFARGEATLALRTDAGAPLALAMSVEHADGTIDAIEQRVDARDDASWHEVAVALPSVAPGDRIALTPHGGAWRGYHAFLTRPAVARGTDP